ncbi:MAG TPA: hypothetical protein VK306_02690 [Acidimicrobiales bacterium]|nr:hypothetical protein [Acidimicrobiales bacterium]
MRIRALSVFEGIVYHSVCVDPANPCRPTLEVDAVLRPGDADAEAGPLLLTVAEYAAMIGDERLVRRCVGELAAKGRLVERMGVEHVSFPTWTLLEGPGAPAGTG